MIKSLSFVLNENIVLSLTVVFHFLLSTCNSDDDEHHICVLPEHSLLKYIVYAIIAFLIMECPHSSSVFSDTKIKLSIVI